MEAINIRTLEECSLNSIWVFQFGGDNSYYNFASFKSWTKAFDVINNRWKQ